MTSTTDNRLPGLSFVIIGRLILIVNKRPNGNARQRAAIMLDLHVMHPDTTSRC